jgi:cytochrome c
MPYLLSLLFTFLFSLLSAKENKFDPQRLTATTLITGLNRPMELEVAPDGRIFFIELDGAFKVFMPETQKVIEIKKFEVARRGEVGLIGLALDPNFKNNNWVYLQYSPIGLTSQRTSRFTLEDNQILEGSEKILLEFHEPNGTGAHHAGSLEFAPNGCLFISTGDNTSPGGDSKGYAPIDNRPDRLSLSAEKSSSHPFNHNGKILRIRPLANGTYETPNGNLFPKDGSKGLPEVYIMGCRNPWRINVNQKTGTLYWGDVGPDASVDSERGPSGHDEINQAKTAGNYGWPYFVGNNFAYPMRDFNTSKISPPQQPGAPINRSRYVKEPITLPPANPAFIWYKRNETPGFEILETGGRTGCAGPVFHYSEKLNSKTQMHSRFDNCLFIYEWTRNWIFAAHLDENENLVKLEPFMPNYKFIRPIDIHFGPDGALYLIEYGTNWGKNDNCKLIRVEYVRGNRPPVGKISASTNAGKAPLSVQFSSLGSTDPDEGDRLSFEWRKVPGDGSILSTEANPTLIFNDIGNIQVTLSLMDNLGATHITSIPLSVGNEKPKVKILSPQDGQFFQYDKPVKWIVSVSDDEDKKIDSKRISLVHKIVAGSLKQKPESLGLSGSNHPGFKIMKKSDCFNCHAINKTLVGPTFLAISEKYGKSKKARPVAAKRIIEGSTGVWGQIPMMPHPQHSLVEAKQMVEWIFSLNSSKENSLTGKTGSFDVMTPKDFKKDETATLLLEASYLDNGLLPLAPLSGSDLVRLRSPILNGYNADKHRGVNLDPKGVKHIGHDSYLCYNNINLSGITEIAVSVTSAGTGGTVELRLGAINGQLLGQTKVTPNGSWNNYKEQIIKIKDTGEKSDLYVRFVKPGIGGGLMNFQYLAFR